MDSILTNYYCIKNYKPLNSHAFRVRLAHSVSLLKGNCHEQFNLKKTA